MKWGVILNRNILFAWTFSLTVGSILMVVLNLIFYGSRPVTIVLLMITAINAAFLMTTYRNDTIKIFKDIFKK